jgi:hypothetical protein
MNNSYSEYLKNSHQLMKMLFSEELYKKMKSTKLKSIDWKGLDIETSSILATFPNIKERFSDEWIEYFKERDYTALDLFLQSVFHYGYQQSEDINAPNRDRYYQMIKDFVISAKNMEAEKIKAQIEIIKRAESLLDLVSIHRELEQQLKQLEDENNTIQT